MEEKKGMVAVFTYPEWQVERAILEWHKKRADFDPKKYLATVNLSYGDRGEFVVIVEEVVNLSKVEQKLWIRVMDKLVRFISTGKGGE